MIRSVVILLALPFALRAQSQADLSSPAAFSTAGAFFALSVADLDGTTRWYTEKLGLRLVRQTPKVENPSVAILAGGGLIVELVHNEGPPSRRADGAQTQGIFKAGVIVDRLDETVALLRARGVELAFGPFPERPSAMANVIIRDNEGNLIQLFGR